MTKKNLIKKSDMYVTKQENSEIGKKVLTDGLDQTAVKISKNCPD